MVKNDIKNDILFDFLAKRSGKAITGDWNKYLVWKVRAFFHFFERQPFFLKFFLNLIGLFQFTKDSKTVTHYGANEGPVQWGRIQYDLNNCNRS